jgi:hypothetical protein
MRQAIMDFDKVPVLCCQRQDNVPFHTIRFAVNDAMRMVWRKLWEQGARRIGCAVLRHEPELNDDKDRYGAALALLAAHPVQGGSVPPLRCHIHDDAAYVAWLRKEKPEGVLCFRPGLWFTHQEAGFGSVPFVTLHAAKSPEVRHIPGVLERLDVLVQELLIRMESMIRHGDIGTSTIPVHSVISPEWWEGCMDSGVPVNESPLK